MSSARQQIAFEGTAADLVIQRVMKSDCVVAGAAKAVRREACEARQAERCTGTAHDRSAGRPMPEAPTGLCVPRRARMLFK